MAAVIGAEILLVFILRGMGVGFDEAILPAPMQTLTFAAITATFAAWWIGWLHRSAADEAHAALLGTNQELKRSEANLSSIFESTDDLVCLLDDQARLVAANRAFFAALRWLGKGQPKEGDALLAAIDGKRRSTWKGRFAQVRSGERVRFEERYQREGRELCLDVSISPVRSGEGALTGFALFGRDITARVDAERKLKAMHHQLVDASRSAGMAEVATSVLHNVGNVLNSVNVGVSLLRERLCRSRVTSLTKASELLASRAEDLAHFLSADERGKQLPAFVVAVSKHLESERRDMLAETEQLTTHVAHITEIVARQQQHAQAVSLTETVSLDEMVEDALRLVGSSFEEQGVTIERDYDPGAAPLTLDRHQLLQILANLLANARDALVASRSSDKRMAVRIVLGASSTRIEVVDNGVGVSAEHLDRIFGQGFTTKKDGHGFGLHASALAAAQMGASLTCQSDGPGEGATFTLSLPSEGATRAA
jgi:PAS domain S-box-containing protein